VKTGGNVSTWKLVIETRPGQKLLPAQRIHLDISAIPSHDPHPMMLRTLYGVDLGTSGLILQAQSREEILADKIVAVALRENRLKNRDLWDIAWLAQQGVELPPHLIPLKIRDHKREAAGFIALLDERITALGAQPEIRTEFMKEMRRFLPASIVRDTVERDSYWVYLTRVISDLGRRAVAAV